MFNLIVVLGSSLALFGGVSVALKRFGGTSGSRGRNAKGRRHDRLMIPSHEGGSEYGYYYDL